MKTSNPKNKYVKPHWKKPKDKHVRRGPAYEIVYLPHMKHKTRRVSLRKKVSSKVRVCALKA